MKTTASNLFKTALFGALLAAFSAPALSERSEDISQFLDRKARSDAQGEQSGASPEEIRILQREAQERVARYHKLPGRLLAAVSRGELSKEDALRLASEGRADDFTPQTRPAPSKAEKARLVRIALVAGLAAALAFFHFSHARRNG